MADEGSKLAFTRCSDSEDDFEKVSYATSDLESNDNSLSNNLVWHSDIEVRRPPAVLNKTAVCTVARSSLPSLANQLRAIASRSEQLQSREIEAQVELRMREERAAFQACEAAYVERVALLEAECNSLAASASQQKTDTEAEVELRMREERARFEAREAAYKKRLALLEAKCNRLSTSSPQESCSTCRDLEQQIVLLRKQAAFANQQKREYEEESHTLRADLFARQLCAAPLSSGPPTGSSQAQELGQVNAEDELYAASRHYAAFADTTHSTEAEVWACPRCTYHNPLSAQQCEMCLKLH